MIIDPYRDGVQIFTDSNITAIKESNLLEVCREIYSRVTLPRLNENTGKIVTDQLYELYIDVGGIGSTYKNILTDMGLKVSDLRYRRLDAILPIRNECVAARGTTEKLIDRRPQFY